jgi:hypothetical protein
MVNSGLGSESGTIHSEEKVGRPIPMLRDCVLADMEDVPGLAILLQDAALPTIWPTFGSAA